MTNRKAVLLANLDMLTVRKTMHEVFKLDILTFIHLIALIAGTPTIMSNEAMANMAERFTSNGQHLMELC